MNDYFFEADKPFTIQAESLDEALKKVFSRVVVAGIAGGQIFYVGHKGQNSTSLCRMNVQTAGLDPNLVFLED